ncbi:MAG: fibronectin type III domain-containing protein [Candidatus Vogelbacteria bacterium]|nr:fibronectin type III domain-containing protein [Candidatus Vogelbacteria bacterium]
MNKKLLILGLVFAAVITLPLVGFGQTASVVPPAAERIQLLNRLRSELTILQAKLEMLKAQTIEVRPALRLTKRMMKGINDQEVKMVQALLATDPEIYPEGYETGYFGVLTEKALKKLQKKAGLAETGEVDDRTLWKINELLTEGAGRSGKIPPGLLRAPGILKKLGLTSTTTPPGQDRLAPVISNVAVASTTATTTKISWQTDEPTTGQVYYATSTPVATGTDALGVALDFSLTTSHEVPISSLIASTTYYYYLRATDRAGNSATTTDASFTTLGQ